VARAAHLAKADLVTELVGEFPELQGTVGRIYALMDGEEREVAQAIEDQYRPRGPSDRIPEGRVSAILALAEKLDNLAAFFSIGGPPSGSSDPFGLRRQTLGILRIIKHNSLSLSLSRAVRMAVENVGIVDADAPCVEILAYVRDRLYQSSTDEGYRYDLARAALAVGFDDVLDFRQRLLALEDIAKKPWWPRLVEVVERTSNILRGSVVEARPNESLLSDPEERALFHVLENEEPAIRELLDRGSYREAARAFTDAFAGPVSSFFEKVFVNVDDTAIRENRLALLARVNDLFAANVADLTRVEKAS
jgi:glycyl-tRNA synthetase beta chain